MHVRKSEIKRFEDKVDIVTESGCWIWTAALWANGRYGCFGTRGRMESAHKVSLRFYRGIDTDSSQHVCHKCDVTVCVNPDHLFVGSASENMRDMVLKGRNVAPTTKLTKSDISEARSLRKGGDSVKAIASKFGISPSQMSRVLKGCLPKGARC